MARSLWTGSLSFGLVNVPVSLVTAVRDLDLHFQQLHEKDAAPIEVQRFCSQEDVEVDYEEITHGYELDDGGQVIVSPRPARPNPWCLAAAASGAPTPPTGSCARS